MTINYLLFKVRHKFQVYRRKKNIIANLFSCIAKCFTYKHDLSYFEKSNAHFAIIQLQRDKTLLKNWSSKLTTFIQNEIRIVKQRFSH